ARRTDQRRISETIRRIEDDLTQRFTLTDLAREAGMSRYHFLRVFREVAGVTPHQFVLRRRLHRAAVRLRKSDEPVSAIDFEEGFDDRSSFNRRFRSAMGANPTAWRAER
ncbi:MAG: AraC family transcriptional regulator, partial [Amphiplicatus sp.]